MSRLTVFVLGGALLSGASHPSPGFAEEPKRVDVFVAGAEYPSFRIPSVVVTEQGTLLAFAEGRNVASDHAANDIVVRRSSDGGKSWSELIVVAEDGDHSLNNPQAVVVRESGRILLMYQRYPHGIHEAQVVPGHEGPRICRNFLTFSDDDGESWSKPADVTTSTKRPERVTSIAGGPGIGIQLRHGNHVGRILMPFNEGPFGVWNIYAVYSDDRGRSWKMGAVAPGGLIDAGEGKQVSMVNEAQLVELDDGSIRFNVRRWGGKAVRKTCVSHDGGETWSQVDDVPELLDPGCMGSIVRYTDASNGGKSRILYSGPQSTKRDNGTVFVSYDEGKTWPVKRVLCTGSFAYSCLTALPDGTIGCLYEAEGTKKIVFARFTLDWLTEGQDSLETK
jgi:sialidase-1